MSYYEGFSFRDVEQHAFVVGRTGSGKTNFLLTMMLYLSDPERQKRYPCSVIFIDPGGDASIDLARMMGSWERLTVLDPTYTDFAMNPLELTFSKPPSREEKARQIQVQVSELIRLLADVLRVDIDKASRMTWIFAASLMFFYHFRDDPNFSDLYHMVNDMVSMDRGELKGMLEDARVDDQIIEETMKTITSLERQAFMPVANRLFKFVAPSDSWTTRTFCARRTTIDWRRMLRPGEVTVVRLPTEAVEGFKDIFMSSLVLKIHFLVQQRRADLEREGGPAAEARTPVYLFVDEAQNVQKLETLEVMLAEARKIGLSLGMATQNLSKFNRGLLQSVLGNAGLIASGLVGPEDAAVLSKVFGEEYREYLEKKLTTGQFVVRVKGHGLGDPVKIGIMNTSRVPPHTHTREQVIDFMKGEMRRLYGGARPDLHPFHREVAADYRRRKGLPERTPLEWRILTYLYDQQDTRLMTRRVLNAMIAQKMPGSQGSDIQEAIDCLHEDGYILETPYTDKVYRGRDGEGNPILEEPQTQDEIARARTMLYSLTEKARDEFFTPRMKGQRAGHEIHKYTIQFVVHKQWKEGFWCTIDTGERKEPMPDIVVYRPKLITEGSGKSEKRKWVWNCSPSEKGGPTAIEVETYPGKGREQVRRNYEKCAGNYAKLLFVVTLEAQKQEVYNALADKDRSTFSVIHEDIGLPRERILGEGPPAGDGEEEPTTARVAPPPQQQQPSSQEASKVSAEAGAGQPSVVIPPELREMLRDPELAMQISAVVSALNRVVSVLPGAEAGRVRMSVTDIVKEIYSDKGKRTSSKSVARLLRELGLYESPRRGMYGYTFELDVERLRKLTEQVSLTSNQGEVR